MKQYLQSQRNWLTVERLPGYAPDLNPVETLWGNRGNIKGREPANRCANDLAELDGAVRSGLTRVGSSQTLPISFLKHAGPSLWPRCHCNMRVSVSAAHWPRRGGVSRYDRTRRRYPEAVFGSRTSYTAAPVK